MFVPQDAHRHVAEVASVQTAGKFMVEDAGRRLTALTGVAAASRAAGVRGEVRLAPDAYVATQALLPRQVVIQRAMGDEHRGLGSGPVSGGVRLALFQKRADRVHGGERFV